MSSTIRIKRSSVSGNPSTLAAGELAYSSLADNGSNGGDRLYIGAGTETSGNAANHFVIGGKYFTDIINAATTTNTPSTLVYRDASSNIYANTIYATVSGNAATSSSWLNPISVALTGDATATFSAIDGSSNVSTALTLATVNSNTGTFGSSTSIPVLTVNGKGLITGVTTAAVASTLGITDGTNTSSVNLLTSSLSILGGTGVYSLVSGTDVILSIGQAVNTNSNVTFNDVHVGGNLYSSDITATNVSVDGNAIITGNLTVQGTTTTVNSTTVDITDPNIILASNATTAAQANGGGITLNGPTTPATFTYSSTNDSWNMNKPLYVSTVYAALSGNAATASKWMSPISIALTGDATATFTSVDGSSNVSTGITLATVNSNVGTFGSTYVVPTITVNAKGLVTAVSSNTIPYASTSVAGVASFDSAIFSVTSGAVTIATIDGGTY